VRVDHYRFDVESIVAANSGKADDTIASPKINFVLGPWRKTEFFVNVGRGFHSNDARGATIRVDPTNGVTPAPAVEPLAGATGVDLGFRTALVPDVQLATSVWWLNLDSELVYVGDAGVTEASGESERYGTEVSALWQPLAWLLFDLDYAWSHARFVDAPGAARIPNAVEDVASVGATITTDSPWEAGLRLRRFGAAPLIEDDSARSSATTVMNGQVSYRFTARVALTLAGFNLLDSEDNDITYFYESQLPGEASPVPDIHFHPVEPRTFRLTLSITLP
jgi:outer membrane receptor protein involved in Fe transport